MGITNLMSFPSRKKCFGTTPNMWSSRLSSNLYQIVDNKKGEKIRKNILKHIFICV